MRTEYKHNPPIPYSLHDMRVKKIIIQDDLYGRFGMFVNSYGGWKNFEKRVRSYNFFPTNPLLESIFIDAAQRAFINKVREGCLREMDCF